MISLKNKKILVTRDAQGAKKMAGKIETFGGNPIVMPLLEINCLPIREDIEDISTFDWVFFTSQNGVACFLGTLVLLEICIMYGLRRLVQKRLKRLNARV